MKNTHYLGNGKYIYTMTPPQIDEDQTIRFDDPNLAHGFTQLPNSILKDRELTAKDKIAYALLLMFAWQNKMCFPGQEVLAFYMGCDKRTAVASIRQLQKRKLIRIERRGLGKTNIYHVKKLTDAYPQLVDRGSNG